MKMTIVARFHAIFDFIAFSGGMRRRSSSLLLLLCLSGCQTAEIDEEEDLGPEEVVQREYSFEVTEDRETESEEVPENSVLNSVAEANVEPQGPAIVENEAIAELTESPSDNPSEKTLALENPTVDNPPVKKPEIEKPATESRTAETQAPIDSESGFASTDNVGDEVVDNVIAAAEELPVEETVPSSTLDDVANQANTATNSQPISRPNIQPNIHQGVIPPPTPPRQVPVVNLSKLFWIGYQYLARDGKLVIELKTKGSPRYNVFQEVNRAGQPELVVRLFDTVLKKSMRRPVDASEFRSPVSYIRTRNNQQSAQVDVLLTMRDPVQPRLAAIPGGITLTYEIPAYWYGIQKANSIAGGASAEMAEPLAAANLYPTFDPGSRTPERIDASDASENPSVSPTSLDGADSQDGSQGEINNSGSWQGYLPTVRFAGAAWRVGQDSGFGGNVGNNAAASINGNVAALPGGPSNAANAALGTNSAPLPNQVSNQADIAAIASGKDIIGLDTDQPSTASAGKRINIDFRNAPLSEVIKAITEQSGVNFIYAGTVASIPVTIQLNNIPWDLAFKSILDLNGLGIVKVASTLYRVDLMANIAREREAIEAARIASQRLEPTKIIFLRLSYAQAGEVAGLVGEMLRNAIERDPRIQIRAEQRTNSLIVEAPVRELARVKSLINRIDLQTPQVKIESRVVEVIKTLNRRFGISWGGPMNFDQSSGLGMGSVPFPNFIRSDFAIDPGVGGGVGNFNIFFGSINNTFNLDLRLAMSESEGFTETLQTNTVFVQNNQSASLTGGQSDVYVMGSSAPGSPPQVLTVDYNINVNVTPTVTADGAVRLTVAINSSSPSESTPGAGANSGRYTRTINTVLLKRSGETAVIGGLNTRERGKSVTGLPVLSRIPIIGALFRSTSRSLNNRELLLMVTPTIMNVAESTGDDSGVVFENDADSMGVASPEGLNSTSTNSEFRSAETNELVPTGAGNLANDTASPNRNAQSTQSQANGSNDSVLEEALNSVVSEIDGENSAVQRAENNVQNSMENERARERLKSNATPASDDADDFLQEESNLNDEALDDIVNANNAG